MFIFYSNYAPLNKKQKDYIKKSEKFWASIAEGGKRAGKNIINIISFAKNIEKHKDKYHLAAGITLAAAKMNIIDCNGFGLLNYFKDRAKLNKYNGKDALIIDEGEKIIIIEGGQKITDAARIKGMSFGSVYITEANEINKNFFFEALDRTLSSSNRKIFLDLNPKPESHWFYKEFLDMQQGVGDINYSHFTIFDNGSISKSQLTKILGTYDKNSNWYQSDILGKRGAGSNMIYIGFGEKNIINSKSIKNLNFVQFSIGIDIGGRDATSAVLIGITNDRSLVILDCYYHKQGDAVGKTHEKYCEEIARWLDDLNIKYNGLEKCIIFSESAEKLFRQSLLEKLRKNAIYMSIYPSYKKDGILNRIRLFSSLINQNRLLVNNDLSIVKEAFYGATWEERGKNQGEWIRADDGSYPIDCLDAAEYAAIPFKNMVF